MNALRAIFVGVGGRGRTHLGLWVAHERLRVVGLVDINPEFLEQARAVTGLPPSACFASLTAALAAVEADTVVIVVHAQLHGRFIREALQAGKHVMVEKPLTCDVTEAEELVALAERQHCRLMVTQNKRYLPPARTLRRLLAAETYGRLGFGHYINYKDRGSAYPNSDHMHLWQMAVHELQSRPGEPGGAGRARLPEWLLHQVSARAGQVDQERLPGRQDRHDDQWTVSRQRLRPAKAARAELPLPQREGRGRRSARSSIRS